MGHGADEHGNGQQSDDTGTVTALPAAAVDLQDLLEPLATTGLVVVESLLRGDELTALQRALRDLMVDAPLGNNVFDGLATRRIFDPLARTRALDDLVRHPLIAAVVEAVVGPAQLGMTVLSEVGPGEAGQRPHRDGSVYPLPAGFGPVMVNAIWAIDTFTQDNGATVVVPSSHAADRRAPDGRG